MVWLLAILATTAVAEGPTRLTCEIGTGAHRSVFDVELDENASTAVITVGSERARTGPTTFGPRYITIVRVIGKETATTVISRAELSARQTSTISDGMQFGSCKPA